VNVKHVLSTYRGHTIPRFHFMARRKFWFAFSGTLIVLSLLGLFVRGLNYSIDFKGGVQITFTTVSPITAQEVTQTMASNGRPDAEVQLLNGGQQVQIRTGPLATTDSQALTDALAKEAGIQSSDVNVKNVGPTWGSEISKKAIRGLIVVLLAIALYITLRFEWKMAVGAMIALVHDVLITAGVYALVGRQVTPETVIAILTILGFSLYDTVVIYDKIKENTESAALVSRLGYEGVVDRSLNQTIMRSVNTSLVVLLPVVSLLLFGGQTLKDFAFAMFIGVAIGAYSSIFIAAPILAIVKGREKRYRELQARLTARQPGLARKEAAAVSVAAPAGMVASDAAAQRVTARQGGQGGQGGGARPRPKSKKRPPAKRKRR
jgi:preprotein translocase subunit SecF